MLPFYRLAGSVTDMMFLQGYTVFSIPVGVVYRPNEAKVRNLQQKDYLGKARLVAASDRSNAFTGFAGTELNKGVSPGLFSSDTFLSNSANLVHQTGPVAAKDDRPAESLSFAASNLVKPGLQSRRQQSEPPNSRNVFPPTPPPENDKTQMTRGQSVRNGPKPIPTRLNLDKVRSNERYEKAASPEDGRPRPTRSASAAPARGFSQREPPRRRRDEEEDAYPEDVYDMYGGAGGSRNSRSQRSAAGRTRERYIEEDEEEGSDYDDASFDEGEFEMVSNRRPPQGSVASGGSKRGSSRRDALRTVRVKVHAGDVRYIVVGPAIEFPDLVDRIQEKFKLRRRFKIKIQDEDSPEGEMITMGDQDDLDMVMSSVKQMARKQRSDTGKMEVSFCIANPPPPFDWTNILTGMFRFGSKKNKSRRRRRVEDAVSVLYPPNQGANTVWLFLSFFRLRSNDELQTTPNLSPSLTLCDHDILRIYLPAVLESCRTTPLRRVDGHLLLHMVLSFFSCSFSFCILPGDPWRSGVDIAYGREVGILIDTPQSRLSLVPFFPGV